MNFPALNGETVTEAHTAICAQRGHATHTVDGTDTGRCPRCGEVTAVVAEPINPKFARMLKLEGDIHFAQLSASMAPMFWERDRAAERVAVLKAESSALFNSLSLAELAAYGAYRKR